MRYLVVKTNRRPMKTEEVIIASKDYRIRHHDDGTKDVQIEGFDGKWYSIHKRVPEFINLGWCYIIKDGEDIRRMSTDDAIKLIMEG